MDKKEVLATIEDIVDSYTCLPLMFFQLGNSGKGYNVKGVVHPLELLDFKESLEKSLNIKIGSNVKEFGNMHINQLCKLCVAKASGSRVR
jgi:hypothetical protein